MLRFNRFRSPKARSPRRSFQPNLEALQTRCLPTINKFTSSYGFEPVPRKVAVRCEVLPGRTVLANEASRRSRPSRFEMARS